MTRFSLGMIVVAASAGALGASFAAPTPAAAKERLYHRMKDSTVISIPARTTPPKGYQTTGQWEAKKALEKK